MRGIDLMNGGKTIIEMNAAHIMEQDVISCNRESTCHEMAEIMFEHNFGSLPIVDIENRLIGIVTECDLLSAMIKGMDFREATAYEVMTELVVSIPEEMPAEEIYGLLQSRHLIRVPVVNRKGKLVGIVARRDILGSYIESTIPPLPTF